MTSSPPPIDAAAPALPARAILTLRGYGDPTQVSSLTQKQAQDLIDSGDNKKLIGGISLGVAGALAATYVVMILTQDEPEQTEKPSLALDWSPSGSTLTWRGSF